MGEFRCLPDTWTYNILISAHIKNNNDNIAAKYLARMKQACLEPNVELPYPLACILDKENGPIV